MSAYSDLILAHANLRGYWRMGDAASPAVDAKNAHNGTAVNSPTFAVTGLLPNGDIDTAVSFAKASSQYISVADHNDLDIADAGSMEAWIKMTSLPAAGYNIFCKGSNGYGLEINPSGALLISKINVGINVASTTTMSTATVYHVVGTKNGATHKLYINGVDVTGSVTNRTWADTAVALLFGAFGTAGTGTANYFDGVLDEVALYNAALTAAEVLSHYNTGITVVAANFMSIGGGDALDFALNRPSRSLSFGS